MKDEVGNEERISGGLASVPTGQHSSSLPILTVDLVVAVPKTTAGALWDIGFQSHWWIKGPTFTTHFEVPTESTCHLQGPLTSVPSDGLKSTPTLMSITAKWNVR